MFNSPLDAALGNPLCVAWLDLQRFLQESSLFLNIIEDGTIKYNFCLVIIACSFKNYFSEYNYGKQILKSLLH